MEGRDKPERRFTESNLNIGLLGIMFLSFSVGTIFSIQLVKYGYYILILSTLIIASYMNTNVMNWYLDIKLKYTSHIFGLIGGIMLLVFLGMQSPQVPFKIFLSVLGFILILPALFNMLRGKLT